MMEQEELKRKLMGLWERSTHNSKELLGVLFDYYFDMRYIEYEEIDGKVVSALCGIPYEFGYGTNKLKGLYLISLTLEEGYHKKGILSDLLQRFNNRIKDEFDFSFLRPHTELMEDYYSTQGYYRSFFIFEERFTSLHDFRKDYLLSLTESDDRIKELKKALLESIKVIENGEFSKFSHSQIIDFIKDVESQSSPSVNLNHSFKDLEYIMNPSSIRNLSCFVSYDEDEKITGVAFVQTEELKRVRVVAFYVTDVCSYFALLDFIKHFYLDYSISVNTNDPRYQIHSIIQQTYVSSNPGGGDLDNTFSVIEIPFNMNKLLQPMGMVKLLRFDKIIEYLATTRSDADFKLHIRDYEDNQDDFEDSSAAGERGTLFVVKNGKCQIEKLDPNLNHKSVLTLSRKEVSELLLRRKDSSNLIMEAFGIPRLNLQMRLLPC